MTRNPAIVILGLVLLVVCAPLINAQGYVEILPDEIKAPFRERYTRILTEIQGAKSDEWAGGYTRYVGETWSDVLVWSPSLGFAAYRDTCSYGPRAWVNFGSARFENGRLFLTSEQTFAGEHVLAMKREYTPVKWGHQRWLIPTDELELFAYAVNSGSWEDYGSFYLKSGGNTDDPKGQPELPSQFKHILNRKPVKAKIVEIGEKPERWYPDVTIDAGKDKGVIVGMSFWLTGVKNTEVKISVASVNEKTAVAKVVGVSHSYEYEENGDSKGTEAEGFEPRPGMIFTSRSPKNERQ
ncbi:MAG TPA: hypothetical protein PKD24_14695 [Pyrinomonadaceae bacterium]|nr:hypothetical protein [Pyrinomonadaceae bacterium]HMP66622.1 hypothetical protein [Pyrinomonadaceae bacterium]